MKMGLKQVLALLSILLFAGALMLTAAPASGDSIINVTTTADEYNSGAACSLREAVVAANTNRSFGGCTAGSGTDSIYLPVGNYPLTRNAANEDASASGDLDIRESVYIYGAGVEETVISAGGGFIDRIFHVMPPLDGNGSPRYSISVSLSYLKITGGSMASNEGGAGILNKWANLSLYGVAVEGNSVGEDAVGGGVTNYPGSVLTVTQSTFSFNTADNGGGIYNGGTATIKNSLFVGNTSRESGGAIDSNPTHPADTVTITNTTISSNTSNTGGGGAGLAVTGKLTVINTTIADNVGVGVKINSNSTLTIANTIIARHAANESCRNDGFLTSKGYNLVDQPAATITPCLFNTAAGDQVSANPYLTDTLIGDASPTGFYAFTLTTTENKAVDGVPAGNPYCPFSDQRMYGRPVDGNGDGVARCDIGAYEAGATFYETYVPIIRK